MNKEKELQKKISNKKQELRSLESKLEQRKIVERNRRKQLIGENYKLKPEHIKLLKEMEFKGIWYGDTVSIGVEGKRPFGNSDTYKDVANILEWELPNDDLSNEQREKAGVLLQELPLAVNEIIKKTQ